MQDIQRLVNLNKQIRRDIIEMTTAAQSGHPTSALSAVELMSTLLMGGHFHHDRDKLIFSKGHGSPLLYALYHQLGLIRHDELLRYRQIDSLLEGHPVPQVPYVDVATGSLGQGLSMGIGMAIGVERGKSNVKSRVYVLVGDSEFAEGQNYEALQIASHYQLDHLVAILDVNGLGQRGETMLGHEIDVYASRVSSFGWKTYVIEDGHDVEKVHETYVKALSQSRHQPTFIIARTVKGKGIVAWEGLNGFHSKQLSAADAKIAIADLEITEEVQVPTITLPPRQVSEVSAHEADQIRELTYGPFTKDVGTKDVTGGALAAITSVVDRVISLDAEVSNSTSIEVFKTKYPHNFYEMYIAEQNMISVAVGLSARGYIPICTTFASFLSRAFDQIRMAQYSRANLKIVASYAGVVSGMDGPSGMGLEDIALMRSILESVVLYPCDAISACKTLGEMMIHRGISYQRLTREKTPTIYSASDAFPIGGSKVHGVEMKDASYDAVIIAAGITVHEALKAQKIVAEKGKSIVVIDAYSIKPIDAATIVAHAKKTKQIIIVEDHYPYGGLGDAVREVLVAHHVATEFRHLCVTKMPKSGKPSDLLAYEQIDAQAILKQIQQ